MPARCSKPMNHRPAPGQASFFTGYFLSPASVPAVRSGKDSPQGGSPYLTNHLRQAQPYFGYCTDAVDFQHSL